MEGGLHSYEANPGWGTHITESRQFLLLSDSRRRRIFPNPQLEGRFGDISSRRLQAASPSYFNLYNYCTKF